MRGWVWLWRLVRDLAPDAGEPLRPVGASWWRWAPHAGVVVAAVVLAAVTGSQTLWADAGVPPGTAVLLGGLQGLPLVLGLIRPVAGWWFALGIGALVSEVARDGGDGLIWTAPSLLVLLGVLGLAALLTRPSVAVVLWLGTLLVGGVLVQRMPGLDAAPDLGGPTLISAVVMVAAGALRGRGRAGRRLADERQRRTLLEERARIARELHDVVAHHMAVVAIQAEAAPYRVADTPEPLRRSFATIRMNALDAMAELHRVLGLLRDGSDGVAPQPGLDQLPALVDNARGAGLAVTATGPPRRFAAGIELSAYRIVQEALSNAMVHAPGADVTVDLTADQGQLRVRVVSGPARGRPGPGRGSSGHGILGMRERAASHGGDLTAGPVDGGGYAVAAVLPLAGGEQA